MLPISLHQIVTPRLSYVAEILVQSSIALKQEGDQNILAVDCQTEQHLRLLLSDDDSVLDVVNAFDRAIKADVLRISHTPSAIVRDIPIKDFLDLVT